jgi:hypothetical protein
MLPFQRSILIGEMLKKLDYWKLPETKETYYTGLSTNSDVPKFGIERDDNGYFYLSDDLISYCNLRNGFIFRIRKYWNVTDWTCYSQLHQAGLSSNKFRMDTPLYREEISIENTTWEYAELQSPNQEYGLNFNDDVFEWPELTNGVTPNSSITDSDRNQVALYYKDFADQAAEVLSAAVQIASDNNVGLPSNLIYSSTRFKDSIGYFWSDFVQNQWVHNKDDMIDHSIIVYTSSLRFAQVCGVLDETRVNDCLTYARTRWTTI